MNQPNSPDQPHNDANDGLHRRENADIPPLPSGPDVGPGYGAQEAHSDPRQDPRWVYSPHDSRDESREIPYFNGYPGPTEDYPQHYRLPYQGPPPKPARRGPLHGFIIAAGILGFGILLIGLLSQLFDWDRQNNPVQEFFDPAPQASPVVPDEDASVDSLISELDHVHEGIAVDWETGGQHTGPGLDPGQEVGSAPGVFMVDTQV